MPNLVKSFNAKIEGLFKKYDELNKLMFWIGGTPDFILNSEDVCVNDERWDDIPEYKEIFRIQDISSQKLIPLINSLAGLNLTQEVSQLERLDKKLTKIANTKKKNSKLVSASNFISEYLEGLNEKTTNSQRKNLFKALAGEDPDIWHMMTVHYERTANGNVIQSSKSERAYACYD